MLCVVGTQTDNSAAIPLADNLHVSLKNAGSCHKARSGGGSHGRRWRNTPARQGGFTCVLRSSAVRARANSGGPKKPLWRAGVFSPWIHGCSRLALFQKASFLRPAQGWSRVWVPYPFWLKMFLPQGWRTGHPPVRRFTATGEAFAAQTLANPLTSVKGRLARFGAKKYGPPISGQAWGAILPPGRQSCCSARSR